jgi:hypothetical protein
MERRLEHFCYDLEKLGLACTIRPNQAQGLEGVPVKDPRAQPDVDVIEEPAAGLSRDYVDPQ